SPSELILIDTYYGHTCPHLHKTMRTCSPRICATPLATLEVLRVLATPPDRHLTAPVLRRVVRAVPREQGARRSGHAPSRTVSLHGRLREPHELDAGDRPRARVPQERLRRETPPSCLGTG